MMPAILRMDRLCPRHAEPHGCRLSLPALLERRIHDVHHDQGEQPALPLRQNSSTTSAAVTGRWSRSPGVWRTTSTGAA